MQTTKMHMLCSWDLEFEKFFDELHDSRLCGTKVTMSSEIFFQNYDFKKFKKSLARLTVFFSPPPASSSLLKNSPLKFTSFSPPKNHTKFTQSILF